MSCHLCSTILSVVCYVSKRKVIKTLWLRLLRSNEGMIKDERNTKQNIEETRVLLHWTLIHCYQCLHDVLNFFVHVMLNFLIFSLFLTTKYQGKTSAFSHNTSSKICICIKTKNIHTSSRLFIYTNDGVNKCMINLFDLCQYISFCMIIFSFT